MFDEKSILNIEKKLIKSSKKGQRISIIMIIACSILIPLYSVIGILNVLDEKTVSAIFNFSISLMWVFNIYLNIKTFKKSKVNIKNFSSTYFERLKRVDNPRYLKETRTKKLKKLGFK